MAVGFAVSLVVKKMDAWTFDMESVACLVDAYSKAAMRDTELFARLSTILQQVRLLISSLLFCLSIYSSSAKFSSLSWCAKHAYDVKFFFTALMVC